jgi:hypothetical protein
VRALRKLFGFLLLVGVAFAGLLVYRRRFAGRRERVDLYYEDGSVVSADQGDDGAVTMLPLATDVIRAARS